MPKTIFTEDIPNKKMYVERDFDSAVENVWRAWTEPVLLDQWWAPLPWKAVTKSMDFREGGTWQYYMEGPDGARHHCRLDYYTVVPQSSYSGLDAFADETGKINEEFPRMEWKCDFSSTKTGTRVKVDITFATEQDLKTIAEMGFKEGFSMAHENLDKLLREKK